ncbi:D-serine ammonia-lyase [Paraburkholderia silvatlantica]|uniref:Probable D-serine dehydratase n=1 Tax=Paraburkholderia silvatlantica TaxID=321895 RepID=A0ABR6FGD2_9BURK|nr:D-serine ammonia-lyase [Paraburkholderia silvatlantica]MBB2926481.1 D-serine dehydratase [Paraburkholderia silvatlantica]PVY25076.1 D-serine ammonia-lyase [Paraburkholderia silvatlantica]PXW30160.1 D-serine ammonia-lyase [Paraburkholderia silvatlantica]
MIDSIYGKPLDVWLRDYPLLRPLMALEPVEWFNPAVAPLAEARRDIALDAAHIADASQRLQRFAPLLADCFADVREAGGIIESPLTDVPAFAQALSQRYEVETPRRLLLKQDSHLPISGSIKARGGIYEVLFHAEQLAMRHGLLKEGDDYRVLASEACRALFREHSIAVGSTGNLGMSIGIASATLGFTTTVHMSADARQWKKDRLRAHGVTVVEYAGDYGEAIESGRRLAGNDPMCHFVDDENSTTLFLGYAVAGERLKRQLEAANVRVDAAHPLFVYLPCGVGGGPGGVAFGLKLAFGDAVHCVFAEPTHSPCMLMGVLTGLHEQLAVQDFGIDNVTAADGLAVGRPSGFVGRAMQRMIDGYYTVEDNELYAMLALMAQTQDIRLEPSALAGAPGFARVSREQQGYRARMRLDDEVMSDATHVIWATGGGMVPEAEMSVYLETGRQALAGS